MKKICFLIGNLNNSGGTERVSSLIANELSNKNYDVSILSLADGTKPFFTLEPHIHTYSLYPQKISFKKNFIAVVWKIRSFIQQHQIETLIVVDSISCMFTVPALIGLEVRHICWEHFNFNNDNGVKFRSIGRKWAAKYCTYVVTLTKCDKGLWEQALRDIKAEIVPIVNPSPYESTNHVPNLEYKVILAVGRLTHVKGFDLLIDAWSLVCQHNINWTLCIVGSGEEEEVLKNQAERLGLNNRIKFIPATKDVEQYYKTSSFYCLSSRFEGLPMVLLEAQAFGLPIVAFDCDTGPNEIIKNEINGWLIENGNVDVLAKQISKSIGLDEDNYRNMSKSAKLSSQKFSVTNIVKIWINIL